jgi:hypothetical protein
MSFRICQTIGLLPRVIGMAGWKAQTCAHISCFKTVISERLDGIWRTCVLWHQATSGYSYIIKSAIPTQATCLTFSKRHLSFFNYQTTLPEKRRTTSCSSFLYSNQRTSYLHPIPTHSEIPALLNSALWRTASLKGDRRRECLGVSGTTSGRGTIRGQFREWLQGIGTHEAVHPRREQEVSLVRL